MLPSDAVHLIKLVYLSIFDTVLIADSCGDHFQGQDHLRTCKKLKVQAWSWF